MEAFVNNTFMPVDRATLQVNDLSIQRGYGVFDFFRIRNGAPLYIEDYLDRFYRSAETMGLISPLKRNELRDTVLELIQRNGMEQAGMKLILTGGYSPDAYTPIEGNLIITQHELVLPTPQQVEKGIHIITYPYRRDLPEVKTINYIMGIWLQKKVKEAKASDVLYYFNHEVSEFPRCNLFLVTKEGTLITPSNYILHGITRMKILQLASQKFKVEERMVTLDEVMSASELFLTSTTKGILPIVKVDGSNVGNGIPGRTSLELSHMLREFESTQLSAVSALLR